MSEKKSLISMKKMLSEAMILGAKLSKHNYKSGLQESEGQVMKNEFDQLYLSTKQFISDSGLQQISAHDVFPVYEEIQKLANLQVKK